MRLSPSFQNISDRLLIGIDVLVSVSVGSVLKALI